MLISTKGRYALRLMIDLAEHERDGYIPLKEIADRQEISEKYLDAILRGLVKGRLIESLRGKGGGYKLSRSPAQYKVGDILRLTEDTLAPVACMEKNASPCARMAHCPTLPMWQALDLVINQFFDSFTLADLARTNPTEQSPSAGREV